MFVLVLLLLVIVVLMRMICIVPQGHAYVTEMLGCGSSLQDSDRAAGHQEGEPEGAGAGLPAAAGDHEG